MLRGFAGSLRLQAVLLRRRLLPRFLAAGAILAGLLPVLGAEADSSAFRVLADTGSLLVAAVAALGAVLGAVAVAADAESGALRAELVRPVSRGTVLAVRALLAALITILLYLTGLGIAAFLAGRLHPYEAFRLDDFVIVEVDDLAHFARRLLLVPLAGLVAASMIGLLVGVLVDDVGTAVVVALGLVEGPLLFGRFVQPLPAWLPTEWIAGPPAVLQDLSQGILTHADRVDAASWLADGILQPLLVATGCLLLAMFVFNRREIRV